MCIIKKNTASFSIALKLNTSNQIIAASRVICNLNIEWMFLALRQIAVISSYAGIHWVTIFTLDRLLTVGLSG